MRLLTLFLILALPAAALAQLSVSEERALYEKHAREAVALALSKKPPNIVLERRVVPSEKVATHIHEAVAGAMFGEKKIREQRPFRAIRSGDFWVVSGAVPGGALGGTAVSVIRAANGEVVSVFHEQ